MIEKIEIIFPFPIDVNAKFFMELNRLITEKVCVVYETRHPDRVMWVSGHGDKMTFSPSDAAFLGIRESDESIPNGEEPHLDPSIYEITISERENYRHTQEVYARPECPFNYCDNPEKCKELGKCRHRT